jgi:hypothetical protein
MLNSAANDQTSFWLQVFSNSKVNGAAYWGDKLPANNWSWPTDTYLQKRLREVRERVVEELHAAEKKKERGRHLPSQLRERARAGSSQRRSVVH